ncbi:ER membrane protein complex subunit 6 [Yarrowia sp. C11]|nr:ER membrane protein complex subunit 6 [Yarrowia sp. E02]KAG5369937.1 ER membrane protein complex subunit 6 [Yarrowia sp. C11]
MNAPPQQSTDIATDDWATNPLAGQSIAENTKSIQYVRSVSSLAIGVGAGILHLESYHGFVFYAIASTVVSILLYTVSSTGNPSRYFVHPVKQLFVDDIFSGLSSFLLMWTLFYELVDA